MQAIFVFHSFSKYLWQAYCVRAEHPVAHGVLYSVLSTLPVCVVHTCLTQSCFHLTQFQESTAKQRQVLVKNWWLAQPFVYVYTLHEKIKTKSHKMQSQCISYCPVLQSGSCFGYTNVGITAMWKLLYLQCGNLLKFFRLFLTSSIVSKCIYTQYNSKTLKQGLVKE